MAFVSGLMGPYMSPIPINASMGMLLSLAIAFVVTPWLARLWIKAPARRPWAGAQARVGPYAAARTAVRTRSFARCSTSGTGRATAGAWGWASPR